MSNYLFDPARLVALAALSRTINAASPSPALPDPIVINDRGDALVPVPASPDHVWCHIHMGVILQWTPAPEDGGALLSLWGGPPDGDSDRDGFVALLTPVGLRGLAKDLNSIADILDTSGAPNDTGVTQPRGTDGQ